MRLLGLLPTIGRDLLLNLGLACGNQPLVLQRLSGLRRLDDRGCRSDTPLPPVLADWSRRPPRMLLALLFEGLADVLGRRHRVMAARLNSSLSLNHRSVV